MLVLPHISVKFWYAQSTLFWRILVDFSGLLDNLSRRSNAHPVPKRADFG
jgi:hypothetical protein